jgi:hypothetical protein
MCVSGSLTILEDARMASQRHGRKSTNPPAGDTVQLRDGGFAWDVPADTLRQLPTVGATGSGMLLANVSQRFSIIHTDAKGDLPVNYSISVRISRDPLVGNDDEAAAVEAAANESTAKRKERDEKDTSERQAAIKAAVQMTKDMIKEGMAINPSQSPVNLIRQVAEVAPVLQQLSAALGKSAN